MLTCKNCGKDKDETNFSKHAGCKSGYDTSRCKACKKSAYDWHVTPIEKRIFNRAKTRAKEKGLDFDIELSDIVLSDCCPVFGKPFIYGDLDWTYSIDRKDPTKGYIKGNVLIISNKANRAKNNLTVDEFKQVLAYMEGIAHDAEFEN